MKNIGGRKKEGYGIYYLPYGYIDADDYKGTKHYKGYDIREDQLKNVFPGDGNKTLVDLVYDKEHSILIAHLVDNESYRFLVIDSLTFDLIDEIQLDDPGYEPFTNGNGFTSVISEKGITAVGYKDGKYQIVVDHPYLELEQVGGAPYTYNHYADHMDAIYANGYFVVTVNGISVNEEKLQEAVFDANFNGLYVFVYEGSELKYCGSYHSSLDDAGSWYMDLKKLDISYK